MIENINSGDDYAQIIMDNIIEGEKLLPEHEQMSINLLTHLSELIHDRANKHWAEYIMGNRETFMFSEDEMMEMFNKAGELYVSDMLDDLVDKNVLEVSVDESGDLLYGLSEEGKKIINDELPKQGRPKKK